MASPSISSTAAVQGTGSIVTESVVEVTLNFTADHNCNIELELSLNGGSSWNTALLHTEANGQNVAPGSGAVVLLDVDATFKQVGFPSRGAIANARVRAKATDIISSAASSWSSSSNFSLKSTLPVISSATTSEYIGSAIAGAAPVVITAHNGDGSTAPTMFRANLSASELDAGSDLAFSSFGDGNVEFAFPGNAEDGEQTIYVRAYDAYYNGSASASIDTWLQRQGPTACTVSITGSSGSSDYTGIKIAEDGTFEVDRDVTVALRAKSPLDLSFKILSTSDVELDANVNVVLPLDADHGVQTVSLTTNPANPTADDFNADSNVLVRVTFYDAADNATTVAAQIRLNTRLYQTAHYPMRSSDAAYRPMLREVTSGGAEVVIPRTLTLATDPERIWEDVFYPSTHSFPTLANGLIDSDAAIAMDGEPDATNDAPTVSSGQLVLDSEGRPVIAAAAWTSDGTKNYGHMVSAKVANRQYWTIDATGHSEFRLEFEHFDLEANVYGPPFNSAAPYRGDCLVIYDASAVGALVQEADSLGQKRWVIGDSTKLVEIAAYTGRGTNVVNLTNGLRMNSGPTGSFVGSWIRGISKVAMIFFSDAAGSGSGFRLKASPAYDRVFINYHVDQTNGRLWIHKHSSLGTAMGAADSTAKRLVYDYLTNPVTIDYDQGIVKFEVGPSGNVEADYSYHAYTVAPSGNWLASQDDFVYYADAQAYMTVDGEPPPTAQKSGIYEVDGSGMVTSGITWDKDRGVAEVAASVVPASGQRLFADYTHHTYTRLSNDGYGDLYWRDSVVVADVTPLYPDYTWADMKITNEGDADLEDAKFKFVARGYDSNNDGQVVIEEGSVDTVLDVNRPWDVQKGTKTETFDKMAVEVKANFLWERSQPKADAMTALAQWKDRVYGDIPARGRAFGRAVWVLGGTSGSAYPATSAGKKRVSLEASGRYYSALVL